MRFDPTEDWRDRAPLDLEMVIRVGPEERQIRIRDVLTRPQSEDLLGLLTASGRIVEVALPLEGLGLQPVAAFSLSITLERENQTFERIPASGALNLTVPKKDFEVHFWQV